MTPSSMTGSRQAARFLSAEIPTAYADLANRRLAYRTLGKGAPIIFANRFRGDLDTWDPLFLDSLAEHHTVVIFDYSGLGRSTGSQATDYMEMARDVKDLAAALGYDKIIAGGWSMGGFVAQLVMTEFPEIVSHGVLLGTRPPGKDVKPPRPEFFANALIPDYQEEQDYVLFFHPKYEASRTAAKASRQRMGLRTVDRDQPLTQSQWEQMLQLTGMADDKHNTLAKLKGTKIPYLVVCGEDDVCFPVEDWFALNGQLPNSHILLTSQSGHGPQHQEPELIARYIANFIKYK